MVGAKGADLLRGGGNGPRRREFLDPGSGRDVAYGGPGDETALMGAPDGSRDVIRCGAGSDKILYRNAVDPRDVIVSCETVDVFFS